LIREFTVNVVALKYNGPGIINVKNKAIGKFVHALTIWLVIERVLNVAKKGFQHVGFEAFHIVSPLLIVTCKSNA
jgi:hypothetical protein